MADAAQRAEPRPGPIVSDDDVTHLVCHCDDSLGLCGIDAGGMEWDVDAETPCPICFTLEDGPCPHCGCVECPDGWEDALVGVEDKP